MQAKRISMSTEENKASTRRGELMGIPSTGRQATVTGMEVNRFVGGKSVEHWLNMGTFGMLQQLGVIPAPEQAS
jgi:predicted ester cyclase